MQGIKRKVVQAILYETGAVLCVTPIIAWFFNEEMGSTLLLSVLLSTIALIWNMVFNALFEYWEARQKRRERTLWRRFIHAVGFEGGLIILFLPLVSGWLNISWGAALVTNAAFFLFFFVYAYAFQWAFDKVFDPPLSAQDPLVENDASKR